MFDLANFLTMMTGLLAVAVLMRLMSAPADDRPFDEDDWSDL